MAQRPLGDGYKGEAPIVGTRLTPHDFARLERIARDRGVTRAAAMRQLVQAALDAAETPTAAA